MRTPTLSALVSLILPHSFYVLLTELTLVRLQFHLLHAVKTYADLLVSGTLRAYCNDAFSYLTRAVSLYTRVVFSGLVHSLQRSTPDWLVVDSRTAVPTLLEDRLRNLLNALARVPWPTAMRHALGQYLVFSLSRELAAHVLDRRPATVINADLLVLAALAAQTLGHDLGARLASQAAAACPRAAPFVAALGAVCPWYAGGALALYALMRGAHLRGGRSVACVVERPLRVYVVASAGAAQCGACLLVLGRKPLEVEMTAAGLVVVRLARGRTRISTSPLGPPVDHASRQVPTLKIDAAVQAGPVALPSVHDLLRLVGDDEAFYALAGKIRKQTWQTIDELGTHPIGRAWMQSPTTRRRRRHVDYAIARRGL